MSKTAFLFPGQGAQSVGMGRELHEQVPAAAALFEQANEILGYDLAAVCFEGPAEKLNSTACSQPGLFVCSLAAIEKVRVEQPDLLEQVDVTAGLSLGEYTALTFAGAMSFEDALRVVQCRGDAMQAASDETPSGMVSILGLEPDAVIDLCDRCRQTDEVLQVANWLCPGNIACSGHLASCEELSRAATDAGAMKVIPLTVAGAFHTDIMASAVDKLAEALASVSISAPRIPVLSNVDAAAHDDPEAIRDLLRRQVISPVQWEPTMRAMLADGCDRFCEIGPGKVLRGLLRRIDRKTSCENIQ